VLVGYTFATATPGRAENPPVASAIEAGPPSVEGGREFVGASFVAALVGSESP
jgi:hypothetical protein